MGVSMFKLKLVIIFLFLLITYSTSKKDDYKKVVPRTAYFTVWAEDAVKKNQVLKTLTAELQKPVNGGFAISATPPQNNTSQPFDFITKKHINFIAWKRFQLPKKNQKQQSYLWQLESPISIIVPTPETYKQHFKKIFTYHKESCDNTQIIYTPIPYHYNNIKTDTFNQSKNILLTLVNTYYSGYNYELRNQTIRWFLENHPQDIYFYGKGWNEFKEKLPSDLHPFFDTQYKGYVKDKIQTIASSKFTIAFENYRFDDYVTEKIYDAMAAGSVPIYSGAPNIETYVPTACFIDYHQFNDMEKLYHFIKTMDDATYKTYLKCMKDFMTNPERHPNHYKNVSKFILEHLDLNP